MPVFLEKHIIMKAGIKVNNLLLLISLIEFTIKAREKDEKIIKKVLWKVIPKHHC
jgi:hypothetical protein